jgi:OmpR-family two-component system manganese-sensing response regulator
MYDPYHVLFVDSDRDSCDLAKMMLEIDGFRCDTSQTPNEALKLLGLNTYSAVILEYRLPEISGQELCKRIRSVDKLTPVIFFSASVRPFDRANGYDAGATSYLIKPNDLEKLIPTTKKLIEQTADREGGITAKTRRLPMAA